MTERLKDPRTWTIITAIINTALAYFKLDQQLVLIANSVIALVAFLLFGVEPVANYIKARRK